MTTKNILRINQPYEYRIKLGTILRSCWPNRKEFLMLRASLGSGHEAIASRRQWCALVEVENLDSGSWRLLPLLWHNLSRQGIKDPILSAYKAAWQKTWIRNQMLMSETGRVIRALGNAGIQPIVLKGLPLALAYYENPGLRPMGDVDLFVQQDDLDQALRILQESGYRSTFGNFSTERNLKHSAPFSCGDRQDLDLHWQSTRETIVGGEKMDFWQTSVVLDLNGLQVLAPGHADMLFNIIAHGTRWNPISPFRWIVDVRLVIDRAGEDLDWDHVVARSPSRRLRYTLLKALLYLCNELNFPIPKNVLQNLKRLARSMGERLEFFSKTHLWGGFLAQWFQHTRLRPRQSLFNHMVTFPAYLTALWNLGNHQSLPSAILFRYCRRLRKLRSAPYGSSQ